MDSGDKTMSGHLKPNTPFDQYTRQGTVANAINFIRSPNENFTILDVGGYKGKTQVSLPLDKVMVADIVDVTEKNYTKASALDLPFENGSYDFVVSFDALEHVSEKDRMLFIDECLRVAKRGVIICAPHNTARNESAENNLNTLYKTIMNTPHRWLKEHIENGLPDFNKIIKHTEKRNFYVTSVFSNDTHLWTMIQSALFTNEKYPQAAPKLIALNKEYNLKFEDDLQLNGEDAYRQIMFAFRDKDDMKSIAKFIRSETKVDQSLQKEKMAYKVIDYYATLLKELENRYTTENEDLHRELDAVNQRLNEITSSKSWQYVLKVSHLKSALKRRV